MAQPFVAEIRIFGFNFAPVGWALCNGQLLPLSQNTALFSLIGTYYGGDGKSNFALPNLQGNAPMHPGQGPGLPSNHVLGETGGSAGVTLLQSEMPIHSHPLMAFTGRGANDKTPGPALTLGESQGNFVYDSSTSPPTNTMSINSILPVGGSDPHNNLMPYLTFNFCIALQGIYPPRQ
jgi:microcystin-dependent protein